MSTSEHHKPRLFGCNLCSMYYLYQFQKFKDLKELFVFINSYFQNIYNLKNKMSHSLLDRRIQNHLGSNSYSMHCMVMKNWFHQFPLLISHLRVSTQIGIV